MLQEVLRGFFPIVCLRSASTVSISVFACMVSLIYFFARRLIGYFVSIERKKNCSNVQ